MAKQLDKNRLMQQIHQLSLTHANNPHGDKPGVARVDTAHILHWVQLNLLPILEEMDKLLLEIAALRGQVAAYEALVQNKSISVPNPDLIRRFAQIEQ